MTVEALGFPLTLWPGTVVPVPPVQWRNVHLLDGKWLVFPPVGDRVEIPRELFIRELMDLDLDSAEDITRFLDSFGMITLRYGEAGLLPFGLLDDEPPPGADLLHFGEAALFLRTARALTRHWMAVLEQKSIAAAWEAEGLWRWGYLDQERAEERAWSDFVHCINWGLKQIHVRVERVWHGDYVDGVEGEPQIGLYSALCLQLVNHIAENATVRRCANETCGRAFVRQEGGAVAGQYRREGLIKYCSVSCGNAQWQREHRRKKRAERGKV